MTTPAWVLLLFIGSAMPTPLATFEGERALQQCVANAQRITARNAEERKRLNPTYPGPLRAHCERIDR